MQRARPGVRPQARETILSQGKSPSAVGGFRWVPLATVRVTLDYRFAPELCWPRTGQQKGAVENLVGWVER